MLKPDSIKICSLREVEHARCVVDVGADLFGLIFVPGAGRQVTVERAAAIVAEVRVSAASAPPLAVGVFVDATAEEINRIVREAGLDLVQLHGSESTNLVAEIDVPAIKSVQPRVDANLDDLRTTIERYSNSSRPPIAYLIDGFHASGHGGEGVRADWKLARQLAELYPVVLAGGLMPENVGEAIHAVTPAGVDVSSGVETEGLKDPAKIVAFSTAARAAFQATTQSRCGGRSEKPA